ncbi:MAG TPA: class 1 isoprenoid biosynthesis enzyme [Candidatus Sulfotelmatobacter sp.]|nr:class 1 isoprenoid biosynthesis enzyme [Candidatus Sulfotelmatobacter sp.]
MAKPSAGVIAVLDEHVARWRGRLPVFAGGAFDERATITELPQRVAEIYPPVPRRRLDELTVALSLFSDAIVACDDIMDYARERPEETRRLPRIGVLFAQTYRTFAELLGPAPHFWNRLERYYADFVDAMDAEVRYATGATPWSACSEEECLAIERGKNGLVRLVDASVAALAGNDRAEDGAAESMLDLFVANQMVDDLRDWREDIRDGALSLVLLRAAGGTKPAPDAARELGARIYLDGHAAHVLAVADAHCRRALEHARALGGEALAASALGYQRRIGELRERLDREVDALRAGLSVPR